ncbi:MAG TPA: FHA domain-containing protein [Haliangium sp.]|nr:FHA domain-containing protein [Haliangium sp.]
MATLTHVSSGKSYFLTSTFLVGRGPTCALPLDSRKVSSAHAVFHWRGQLWELRDLHSKNGTFVNQRRLEPGEAVTIARGASIAFGDFAHAFALAEDAPPRAMARAEDGRLVLANDEGFLALPGPEQAEISISSHGGQWFVDTDDDRMVRHGDVLHAGGMDWRLDLPVAVEKTLQADERVGHRVDGIGLRFTVSRDGSVDVDVLHGRQVTRLRPRAHHHLLLALARRRLTDQLGAAISHLPASDHGWMSHAELLVLLSASENSLNLDIHRARRQIGDEAGILDGRLLIERRRGGKIRLGASQLAILP